MKKLDAEKHIEMMDTCNQLCFTNYTSSKISSDEAVCLSKCFNKVLEMNKFIEDESYRLFVQDVKEFNTRDRD